MNIAPQTAQGCSWSDRVRFSEIITFGMPHPSRARQLEASRKRWRTFLTNAPFRAPLLARGCRDQSGRQPTYRTGGRLWLDSSMNCPVVAPAGITPLVPMSGVRSNSVPGPVFPFRAPIISG